MATPEPNASDSQAKHAPMEEVDKQSSHSDSISSETTVVDVGGSASDSKSGVPEDSASLYSHVAQAQPRETDQEALTNAPSSAPQLSPSLVGSGQLSSAGSKQLSQEDDAPVPSSTDFTFTPLDRRDAELGHIQDNDLRAAPREGISSPKRSPVFTADDAHAATDTIKSTASSVAADDNDTHQNHAHHDCSSTGATPFGSDAFPEAGANPSEWHSYGSISHQVDEQINREASARDGLQHGTSSASPSEDVVYLGAGPLQVLQTAFHGSTVRTQTLETLQHFSHSPNSTRKSSIPSSPNNVFDGFRTPGTKSAHDTLARRSVSRPAFQPDNSSRGHVNGPAPASGGIQELLEVVEYKFKQNEQQLRRAFGADSARAHNELQQAREENEELRSQVAALDERCNHSEAAILKYRNQILKAKSLQKFLDGLGVDLHSLKGSYDFEKKNFAQRIEASEMEIKRLESTLGGKDQFESMLSHSKASLEKLLEAKGFELQSLVQHRDLLKTQLDERIGQLVEERDNRMRLEQLVLELRNSERSSLTNSIEQCVASLTPQLGDLRHKDDRLLLSMARIQTAVDSLTQTPTVSPDDCEAIKAAIHDLGLRTAQMLNAESCSNPLVAEVCSSVEGIIQSHARVIHRGLDRFETTSKQRADEASTEAALHAEVQHATALFARTDPQLDMAKQREKSLSDALAKAEVRISELEAASDSVPASTTDHMSSHEVEKKISEAVAMTRKELSENARTFIAQEKARFANEFKKVSNEHRKAAGKVRAYGEKIDKLQNELAQMQSLLSVAEDQRSAHQTQEVDSDLVSKLAEEDATKARIAACDNKITELTQGIEQRNTDLLHARTMCEHAQTEVEEMRRQRQSDVDDLRQKLCRVEEKSKVAEARIAQTKTDAEHTISTEQLKHREDMELLQQRLEQAQSELQMRSEEADDAQAFMERNFTQQQDLWQNSNAELEAKASRFQIMLEEERQVLQRTRKSQDDLRAAVSSLEAEIGIHRQQQVDYNVCEDASQVIIADLKTRLDASQTELTKLQAVQQRYLREKDQHFAREDKAKSTSDHLRKELDAAEAKVAELLASKESGNRPDAAQFVLDQKQAACRDPSQPLTEDDNNARGIPIPSRRLAVVVPNRESQSLEGRKQRRKADRSTNTVVDSDVRSGHMPAAIAPALGTLHIMPESDFRIYEDPQHSSNQDLNEDNIAQASRSAFHKRVPLPNSGSKRLTRTTSDKSSQGRGTQRTPENSFGQFSSQVYKTPEATNYPFGSSPEFMNPSNTKTKRRYSGNSHGTLKDVQSPLTKHPETLLPDPRIAAKSGVSNRSTAKRGQQDDDMLGPPAKRKHTSSAATQLNDDRMNDNTFTGRSSQSVNSLPRIEDLSVGRSSQVSSSHMRSSAEPRRITRSQRGTKGNAYSVRFRQELQR